MTSYGGKLGGLGGGGGGGGLHATGGILGGNGDPLKWRVVWELCLL